MRLTRIPGVRAVAARFDAAVRWRTEEAVGPLRGELEAVRAQAGWTANEMERLAPHVAALDARLEDLRVELTPLSAGEPGDLVEALSLLDEVRREHAAIRVRLSMLATYAERLERLEEQAFL